MIIFGSQNVTVESVTMKSPGDSPNTDGIHLSHSNRVTISNTNIGSGKVETFSSLVFCVCQGLFSNWPTADEG